METSTEKELPALGGLFNQIITDLKNGAPMWEDFILKASRLHNSLKSALQAISAFLESLQKIADAATNARGATKELGTALTRVCLRQKAVETKMKSFTSAIMDCLVVRLQEKLEDWKKAVLNLDKEHSKDYKRARAELKKRSADTLRLARKACSKGGDLRRPQEAVLTVGCERRRALDELETRAARAALLEERRRYCGFVQDFAPVLDEEISMLQEITHLQDAVEQLEKHSKDPGTLPPASEQVLVDLRAADCSYSPPSSPSSLGSRKSSMCSISSLNSSSSGGSKSPSQHNWYRTISQSLKGGRPRAYSSCSRDSGFTSQDALCHPRLPFQTILEKTQEEAQGTATWPNLQDTLQFERAASAIINDRPHTISSAYEKGSGRQRPALTVYTFQQPDAGQQQQPHQSHSQPVSPISTPVPDASSLKSKPPLPLRSSSLERPGIPVRRGVRVLPPGAAPCKLPIATGDTEVTYSNLSELVASLPPPPPPPTESNTRIQVHTRNNSAPMQSFQVKDESEDDNKVEPANGFGSQTSLSTIDSTSHIGGRQYGTLTRRGVVPPPPPIRRSSAVSVEHLPPPPAFLLDNTTANTNPTNTPPKVATNVAETVKVLNEMRHTPASPGSVRRFTYLEQQQQQQQHQPQHYQQPHNHHHSVIYATAKHQHYYQAGHLQHHHQVQHQQHQQHQQQQQQQMTFSSFGQLPAGGGGGGGSLGGYADPAQLAKRFSKYRAQLEDGKDGSGRISPAFLASLSAKLTPASSPKPMRRLSDDATCRRPSAAQELLQVLNSRLQQPAFTSIRASRIRQIINSKVQPDPKVCHESLMDQIKQGAALKKTRAVNDRSAPKIR